MARTKKNQTETKTDEADVAASHTLHLERLQKRLDSVVRDIESRTRGFTGRAIRARSVNPNVIEAGFAAMEASIQRGRDAYAASREHDDVGEVARVDLRTL